MGHNDGRRQTSLHVTTSGVEIFRRNVRPTITLIEAHDDRRGERKEQTETDDDAVARAFGEHGVTAEEARVAGAHTVHERFILCARHFI